MATAVILTAMCPGRSYAVRADEQADDQSQDQLQQDQTADPVDDFLARSAFIGNSVGEGLTMYNNSMKKVPLANATMLTRVSYSFYADRTSAAKFLPVYNGTPMQAAQAVKQCGAKYVFICMGTNDLVGKAGVENAYEQYLQYIAGIYESSPDVLIFIESCTPTRPGSNVNNEKVAAFNALMKDYCEANDDIYYVDIATPLSDESGYLASSYSSDGSVHLTNGAYKIWADTVRDYIADFLADRREELLEQQRSLCEQNEKNYRAVMAKVSQKKERARQERLVAERAAEEERQAAEMELKHYRLLNVPDEVTIMRLAVAEDTSDPSEPAYIRQHPEDYLTCTTR